MAYISLFAKPLLSLFLFCCIAQALVPLNETFKYVNEGELGPYVVEYDANYRVLSPFAAPFQLCFYNTTPNAYTLALRMGLQRTESIFRWVWEANRGNPVSENATLTFEQDGNLVLADADGRIAWQTNTANKGVVGFRLLPNGNMVLYDYTGKFIWQSFDYPTDTLLVGQSLRLRGPNKLVSRASEVENSPGPYSLVFEPKRFALYFKSSNSPKQYVYYDSTQRFPKPNVAEEYVTLTTELEENSSYIYLTDPNGGSLVLAEPKYNATSSFLRIDLDGNLRIYTYIADVDIGGGAWRSTLIVFAKDSWETECQLPAKCGKFGLCEDSNCVSCPLPNGLTGWTESCEPKKVSSCAAKDFYYYKLEGVDHFSSKFNKGESMKLDACGNKCTKDCKCLGYFYNTASSKCWIAYDLKTLTKVGNSTHLGFIKAPKN
ncbi:epidermis-specific secreted glycoprotein EP1-like [Tripterygium wilfordii]|uniref:epidermis-specific secreted glycoprotein EP1-like n=1 Tax=Tripterygium wilfordii TaxID=458696 RepID=UPI0018F81E9A|nr:epidermis-specific secreted glycoprotein EP1-like [Tripterygium wilfordii]